MEKAIHVTHLKNLRYFKKGAYQRIYWGVEFCQNLIPALEDTKKILSFIKQNNLSISLTAPFVTETGLKKLNYTFQWLKRKNIKNIEIIVNDWGVLELLNREFNGVFEMALGRLLVRQQRDPAIKKVLERQKPFAIREKNGNVRIIVHHLPALKYQIGMRGSYINSSSTQDFLSGFGIKRIELNNLIQGLNLEGIKLKKSLYIPYVNISTTRFCPMETRFQKIYRINICKKECQRWYDVLRNPSIPKVIYKRGNTTFYKNHYLDPLLLKENGIDRIVFQPQLPF